MPDSCPTIDEKDYHISRTGLRLVHNDQCKHIERVIDDTDGRVSDK
jgi:hypothetical protein